MVLKFVRRIKIKQLHQKALEMGMKSLQINVKGKVQGVFFRASTKAKANELGLKGFVRNEKDGSVYIEVEGEELTVERLIKWLHVGPSNAIVTKVTLQEQPLKAFAYFEIRRH